MSLKIPKAFVNAGAKTKALPSTADTSTYKRLKVGAAFEDIVHTKSVSNESTTIDVQDAEHDKSLLNSLDYSTWLKFAAKTYKISPSIEDYILVTTLICPSDIPNRNGVAFPASELARFLPPPTNRQSYKAWAGCPVHLEHDNEDHEKAYGVILDTALHKVRGYGGGKLWKVMGLLAIDKNKYPDIAMQVLKREINTYSMGALVDEFTCGYCGAPCTDKKCCTHISSPKEVNWGTHHQFDGSSHLSFLNSHGIQPIETSIVRDPAWAPALSDSVLDFAEADEGAFEAMSK